MSTARNIQPSPEKSVESTEESAIATCCQDTLGAIQAASGGAWFAQYRAGPHLPL